MRRSTASLSHQQGVARECGITYRQLDYWTRTGYLRPIPMGGMLEDATAALGDV